MDRPQWEQLPAAVRNEVQDAVGLVLKAEAAHQGLMPGIAATLHTESGGRAFLKAISVDSPAARLYERERWAGTILPADAPTPRMTWSSDAHGWIVMLFEHIDGCRVDLSPGSSDVPEVLNTVRELGALAAPGNGSPLVADNVEFLLAKGRHLMAKPASEVPSQALYAAAIDGFDIDELAGDTLLHYDLHAGNLMVTGQGVRVIDWGFAADGAPWVDAAMLAPRLIEAGHTPGQAEELLSEVPAWASAPERAATGLAALWTLFRLYKAMYGPEDGREFRTRAAEAGRAWVEYRTT
ncbi:phosphotransferase family protein [Nonomuraea sp. NPDC050536]|uniref:phosphotransferase family protein n=1 Tax=Nonomuraea sp. NPDC050536 TaxID=3364366 RepID=UPI0037C5C822